MHQPRLRWFDVLAVLATLLQQACGGDGGTGPDPGTNPPTFQRVLASDGYSCGLAVGGAAYCWGANWGGVLGDGTASDRSILAAVSGGLVFQTLTIGNGHACGLRTGGAAYCWGYNGLGGLGDGTYTDRYSPVAVLLP